MKILLSIDGGIGKNIAATGAIREAYNNDHVIDVITAWPVVFEGNPYINKVYEWDRYEYIRDRLKEYDKLIFNDPYRQQEFIKGDTDLTSMFNYLVNGKLEYVKPELYFSLAEELEIKEFIKTIKKPIFLIQTNGGQTNAWMWPRDYRLEEAVEVLNVYNNEYEIIHLRGPHQPSIDGIKHTGDMSIRQCMLLLKYSTKRLLIDSVYQHASAAMDLPSIVLFNNTDYKQFSHPIHTVVQAEEPKLRNMDRIDGLLAGLDNSANKCPFSPDQIIFDKEKVLDALKEEIMN